MMLHTPTLLFLKTYVICSLINYNCVCRKLKRISSNSKFELRPSPGGTFSDQIVHQMSWLSRDSKWNFWYFWASVWWYLLDAFNHLCWYQTWITLMLIIDWGIRGQFSIYKHSWTGRCYSCKCFIRLQNIHSCSFYCCFHWKLLLKIVISSVHKDCMCIWGTFHVIICTSFSVNLWIINSYETKSAVDIRWVSICRVACSLLVV